MPAKNLKRTPPTAGGACGPGVATGDDLSTYLADLIRELQKIADEGGLKKLSGLLERAHEEAEAGLADRCR